jgi:hypothetical protein
VAQIATLTGVEFYRAKSTPLGSHKTWLTGRAATKRIGGVFKVPRPSPETQNEDIPVAALIGELHLCKTNCNNKHKRAGKENGATCQCAGQCPGASRLLISL